MPASAWRRSCRACRADARRRSRHTCARARCPGRRPVGRMLFLDQDAHFLDDLAREFAVTAADVPAPLRRRTRTSPRTCSTSSHGCACWMQAGVARRLRPLPPTAATFSPRTLSMARLLNARCSTTALRNQRVRSRHLPHDTTDTRPLPIRHGAAAMALLARLLVAAIPSKSPPRTARRHCRSTPAPVASSSASALARSTARRTCRTSPDDAGSGSNHISFDDSSINANGGCNSMDSRASMKDTAGRDRV